MQCAFCGKNTAMRLTPDEIRALRFPLSPNGYECESVDRFLAEAIELLQDTPANGAGTDSANNDDFARAGQEIAVVLRSARDSANALRAEAEGHAVATRARADVDAEEIHNRAVDELQQAEQILAAAKAESEAILAEAKAVVAASVETATEQARLQAAEITKEAETHAEQIRRGERAVHQRLLAARTDLDQAIDRLIGSAEKPVLDLTMAPPHLRTGSIIDRPTSAESSHPSSNGDATPTRKSLGVQPETPDSSPEPSATPVTATHAAPDTFNRDEDRDTDEQLNRRTDIISPSDPVLRMVRAAVGRAIENSATERPDDQAPAV